MCLILMLILCGTFLCFKAKSLLLKNCYSSKFPLPFLGLPKTSYLNMCDYSETYCVVAVRS